MGLISRVSSRTYRKLNKMTSRNPYVCINNLLEQIRKSRIELEKKQRKYLKHSIDFEHKASFSKPTIPSIPADISKATAFLKNNLHSDKYGKNLLAKSNLVDNSKFKD